MPPVAGLSECTVREEFNYTCVTIFFISGVTLAKYKEWFVWRNDSKPLQNDYFAAVNDVEPTHAGNPCKGKSPKTLTLPSRLDPTSSKRKYKSHSATYSQLMNDFAPLTADIFQTPKDLQLVARIDCKSQRNYVWLCPKQFKERYVKFGRIG